MIGIFVNAFQRWWWKFRWYGWKLCSV